MNKKTFLIVFSIIITNLSFGQYTLIEKIEPSKDQFKVIIPYAKYQFDNGLTLILHEDHSDPIVHVDLSFRIGSVNENPDMAGNVFFISQLMNDVLKDLPGGSYSKYIEKYGGKCYTKVTRDKTSYSVTIANNMLKTILWLESNRIANFTKLITQEDHNNQKEKILQMIEDKLYSSDEDYKSYLSSKALYEFGHPYSWMPFGKNEYHKRGTLVELKKFYLDWYGPNNAILTIGGDFNSKKTLKLIKKYFGSLTQAPMEVTSVDSKMARINPAEKIYLDSTKYTSYQYGGKKPLLRIVYPTTVKYSHDEAALNILADYLGKAGFLSQNLIDGISIESIEVNHSTSKYAGEFIIDVVAGPDIPLSEVKNKIIGFIDSFFNMKKFEKRLDHTRDRYMHGQRNRKLRGSSAIFDIHLYNSTLAEYRTKLKGSLETNKEKVTKLSDYEFFLSNPNYLDNELRNHEFFKPINIFKICNKYIASQPALIISIVPKGKTNLIAAPDNHTIHSLKTIITPVTEDLLVYRKPGKNSWKKLPKIKKAPEIKDLSYSRDKMEENGLKLLVSPTQEGSEIVLKLRSSFTSINEFGTNVSYADFTSSIIEANINHFRDGELKKILADMGVNVTFATENNDLIITFKALKENLMSNTNIIREILFIREEQKYSINLIGAIVRINQKYSQKHFNYTELATNLNSGLFQIPVPIGQEFESEEQMYKAIFGHTLAMYNMFFVPSKSTVTMVGSLEMHESTVYKEIFREWGIGGYGDISDIPPDPGIIYDTSETNENNVFLLDRKEPVNTSKLIISYPDLPIDHANGNYLKSDLFNYILGERPNSTLSTESNSDYIISINSSIQSPGNKGILIIEADVRSDKIDSAILDITKIVDNFNLSTLSKKEFKELKLQFAFKDIINYETNSKKADRIYMVEKNKLGKDYFSYLPKELKKIKSAAINEYSNKHLSSEKRNLLIAGNKNQLLDKLNQLELGKIIEIDKFGKSLNL